MTVNVVIGTDGSDDAIAAAQRAVGLLAPGAAIHLICVAEEPSVVTSGMVSGFSGGIASPETIDAALANAENEATAALGRTKDVLGGAVVESYVEHGAPGPVLCERAAALGADVLVVGSRGQGAIRRVLLGSVSTHVVHNAPCPVLVIRAEPESD